MIKVATTSNASVKELIDIHNRRSLLYIEESTNVMATSTPENLINSEFLKNKIVPVACKETLTEKDQINADRRIII